MSDKNFYITGSKEITEHNWQLIWEAGMIVRFANQLYMNIFLWLCHFVGVFCVLEDYIHCSLVRVLCHHLNGKELRNSSQERKKEDRNKELLNPLKVFC